MVRLPPGTCPPSPLFRVKVIVAVPLFGLMMDRAVLAKSGPAAVLPVVPVVTAPLFAPLKVLVVAPVPVVVTPGLFELRRLLADGPVNDRDPSLRSTTSAP